MPSSDDLRDIAKHAEEVIVELGGDPAALNCGFGLGLEKLDEMPDANRMLAEVAIRAVEEKNEIDSLLLDLSLHEIDPGDAILEMADLVRFITEIDTICRWRDDLKRAGAIIKPLKLGPEASRAGTPDQRQCWIDYAEHHWGKYPGATIGQVITAMKRKVNLTYEKDGETLTVSDRTLRRVIQHLAPSKLKN